MLINTENKAKPTVKSDDSIDRDSFEPVYSQLANILTRRISSGELAPGERLPSEAGLCKLYGVSPMTVRRTVSFLVDQGVVYTERGRGTFVKRLDIGTATFNLDNLQKIYEDASNIEVKILGVELVPADDLTARKLDLKREERTIHLKRLLLIDHEPFFYHYEYMICDIHKPIVEAEMEVTSMQGFFRGSGSNLYQSGELDVQANLMTEEEADILEVQLPYAALYLTHIFYDNSNQPMSWGRFVCKGDRLSLSTKVGINSK